MDTNTSKQAIEMDTTESMEFCISVCGRDHMIAEIASSEQRTVSTSSALSYHATAGSVTEVGTAPHHSPSIRKINSALTHLRRAGDALQM